MAGAIGATTNNGAGVASAAQLVTIIPCRFMGATGSGDLSNALQCFDYCIQQGAHVSVVFPS